jgi:hypothetical protein
MGRASNITPKRRIGIISQEANRVPMQSHEGVRMPKRGWCVYYKGLRCSDRPKKRVAMREIAANQSRKSSKHMSQFGCKQCNVYLCKERGCFEAFHR